MGNLKAIYIFREIEAIVGLLRATFYVEWVCVSPAITERTS